jgi:hypothetical protein
MKRLIRDPLGWGINSGRVYPAHTNGTPHHDLQVTWLCLLPPGCVAIFCRRAWDCYVADACCRVDNWVLLSLHDRTKFVSVANSLIPIAVDLLW